MEAACATKTCSPSSSITWARRWKSIRGTDEF
jgi:hypothetical protein